MFRKYLGLISSLICLLLNSKAFAISFDDFDGQQEAAAHPTQENFSGVAVDNVLGGHRGLKAIGNTGLPNLYVRVRVESNLVSHSQDATVTGQSLIIWDGDSEPGVNFTGLGGLDLTQDGGTGFVLDLLSYDFPGAKPLPLKITVYDASDLSGNRSSSAVLTLAQSIDQLISIPVPFANFTTHGTEGPADFRNVGAITLMTDGTSVANVDLTLDWIGTNGKCRLVPDQNRKVIDACGVCGGDGKSCLDCAGVPFGDAQVDRCGICSGDGQSCISCVETDLSTRLAAMDGGAKKQERIIKQVLRRIEKTTSDQSLLDYVKVTAAKTHKLQIRNWILSWTVPNPSRQCETTSFCTSASHSWIIEEYRTHSEELRQITIEVVRKLRSLPGQRSNAGKIFINQGNRQHNTNLRLASLVPLAQFSCS